MVDLDVSGALEAHKDELRQRLCEWAGDGVAPEAGSDAAMLLDALCGEPQEEYLPRFETSSRTLARQGGRLEARLAGIQRWSAALASGIADIFAEQPALMAQAQRYLGALVASLSVTIAREFQAAQTQRLREEMERAQRSSTRLAAVQRVNAVVNSNLDLDQTLTTAARIVAEELGADLCVISLFDEITRELEPRAISDPSARDARRHTQVIGQGYTGWVAEQGRPLLVPDVSSDPRFSLEANAYPIAYRGLVSVPIIFFSVLKLEGVMSVHSREPRAFGEDDVHFLEVVAGQLAMNIENGRLHEQTDEELRRKVHELSTLHRVSALVTSTLVLDNVLRMIVGQAVQLTGADRSALFQLDPATQRLRIVASHGFEQAQFERTEVALGQCCVGRAARSGEPITQVDCMRNDESCFLFGKSEAIGDQRSVLCAPLMTGHGSLGALCVFSSQRGVFGPHHKQLVTTFANVSAIALENARLFEQTREGLRTRDALLREMHHRVKNNLQQVAAILNMQRRRAKLPEVRQALLESVDRIQGIAATHDLLSTAQLGMAPVDEIARKIASIVMNNTVPPQFHLRSRVGSAPFHVSSEQATTIAILLNELIANAIEHGFEGRERGEIRISATHADGSLTLRVADDGVGLPEGFSVQTADGLGLQLVRSLVSSNLRGAVEVFRLRGDPDLRGPNDERSASLTDPSVPAVPLEKLAPSAVSEADEREWTVAQVRFPLSLQPEKDAFALPLIGERVQG